MIWDKVSMDVWSHLLFCIYLSNSRNGNRPLIWLSGPSFPTFSRVKQSWGPPSHQVLVRKKLCLPMNQMLASHLFHQNCFLKIQIHLLQNFHFGETSTIERFCRNLR